MCPLPPTAGVVFVVFLLLYQCGEDLTMWSASRSVTPLHRWHMDGALVDHGKAGFKSNQRIATWGGIWGRKSFYKANWPGKKVTMWRLDHIERSCNGWDLGGLLYLVIIEMEQWVYWIASLHRDHINHIFGFITAAYYIIVSSILFRGWWRWWFDFVFQKSLLLELHCNPMVWQLRSKSHQVQ